MSKLTAKIRIRSSVDQRAGDSVTRAECRAHPNQAGAPGKTSDLNENIYRGQVQPQPHWERDACLNDDSLVLKHLGAIAISDCPNKVVNIAAFMLEFSSR